MFFAVPHSFGGCLAQLAVQAEAFFEKLGGSLGQLSEVFNELTAQARGIYNEKNQDGLGNQVGGH